LEQWRLIEEGPSDAFLNMAVDEAIALSVKGANAPPTLRFYEWSKMSVSIGCFQKIGVVDGLYCNANGIPIVRRPTGGRAILHWDELTYSFSARTEDGFHKGLLESYRLISGAFFSAFLRLGIDAGVEGKRRGSNGRGPLCFDSLSYGELSVGTRKLIGSAQRRWQDGLLQQGSMPFRHDFGRLKNIFKLCEDSAFDPAPLDGAIKESLKRAIRESFEERFSVRLSPSSLTEMEREESLRLLHEKYLCPEWNHKVR
jgi:lipoate-protein ligase A